MNLNELIVDSLKVITEGKSEKQQTSGKFTDKKTEGIEDINVKKEDDKSHKGGLEEKLDKKNTNPQGEGGEEAIPDVQKNPKVKAAVVAGIAHGGIGATIHKNEHVKYTPPAPATK